MKKIDIPSAIACRLKRWYLFYWRDNELFHILAALFVAGAVLIALRALGRLSFAPGLLGAIEEIACMAVIILWFPGFLPGLFSLIFIVRLYRDRKAAIASTMASMTEFTTYTTGLAPAIDLLSAVKSCGEGNCTEEEIKKKRKEMMKKLEEHVYREIYNKLKEQEEREDPCRRNTREGAKIVEH